MGSWVPGQSPPRSGLDALREAVQALARPVVVVERDGRPAVVEGGRAQLGVGAREGALPLLAWVPPLLPEQLGDAGFRADHQVGAAYVAGEMANGIASEQLVEAIARAGMLGIFGAAGLPVERIEQALDRLEQNLPGLPWGVNLIHSPDDPRLEAGAVELFLRRGLRFVSASAYLELTSPVVRYRVAGIHRDPTGKIVVPNRLMAKVSRVEVARKFLEPAPARLLAELVAAGQLTAEEAKLAAEVPMADDVTAEADSGGHTDNRPLVLLLPALQALRDEVCAARRYPTRPRIGAAGGLATPASIASAFSMGAAYVVTGSINQATREAGTSDAVRALLAQAASTDVAMAPAADMFELGVKVQVLTRGTLFAVRAARLHEFYRTYESVEALPAPVRLELEQKYFRCTLPQAWEACVAFFTRRDPRQLERAAREPKHQLALLLRG